MNNNKVYIRAQNDWVRGVFCVFVRGDWRLVFWDYSVGKEESTFVESVAVSEQWATNILKANPQMPVYQELDRHEFQTK